MFVGFKGNRSLLFGFKGNPSLSRVVSQAEGTGRWLRVEWLSG